MKSIAFEILGKPWKLRLFSRRKFDKKGDCETIAETYVNKRIIDIGPEGKNLEVITHEIVHAFLGEICTGSANLDHAALEEICADLFAKRGFEMIQLADMLLNKIHSIPK